MGIISLNVFISLLYTKGKKKRDALRKSSSETHLRGFIQKKMYTKKNDIISKT